MSTISQNCHYCHFIIKNAFEQEGSFLLISNKVCAFSSSLFKPKTRKTNGILPYSLPCYHIIQNHIYLPKL